MATPVAQLVVEIAANSAQFRTELARARGDFNQFTSGIKSAVSTLAGAVSVGAFASLVKSAVSAGSAINDLSIRMGLSTDRLQALQFAARQAGADVNDLELGLRGLNRTFAEAARDQADAREALAQLGMSWRTSTGATREASDSLEEFAQKFAKLSETAKVDILQRLGLGRARGFRNLLDEIAQGYGNLEKTARDANQVLDPGSTKALDRVGDEFDKATNAIRVGFMRAVAAAEPALLVLAKAIETVGKALSASLDTMRSWRDTLGDIANKIQDTLGLAPGARMSHGVSGSWDAPAAAAAGGAPAPTVAQQLQAAQAQAAAIQSQIEIAQAARRAGLQPGSAADIQQQIADTQELARAQVDALAIQRRIELTDKGRAEIVQKANKIIADSIKQQIQLYRQLEDVVFETAPREQQVWADLATEIGEALGRVDAALVAQEDAFKEHWTELQITGREGLANLEASISESLLQMNIKVTQLLKAQRIEMIQEVTGPIFDSLHRALSGTVSGILLGTQTVEQAFANMGRNIAASLIESVIHRGIDVVRKALEDLVQDLIASGLIRQAAQMVAGAVVGLGFAGTNASAAWATAGAVGGGATSPVMRQHGGVVTRPEIAMLGEAGPEAVIPLHGGGVPVALSGATGASVVVNVINQAPGTTAEHSESTDGGQRIHNIIIRAVRRASQTGEFDTVMATYGVRRPGLSRA